MRWSTSEGRRGFEATWKGPKWQRAAGTLWRLLGAPNGHQVLGRSCVGTVRAVALCIALGGLVSLQRVYGVRRRGRYSVFYSKCLPRARACAG